MFNALRLLIQTVPIYLLLSGCSTTAVPAKVNVPSHKGVYPKTLVVQEFRGATRRQGQEIRNSIIANLKSHGHVEVLQKSADANLIGQLNFGRLKEDEWEEEIKKEVEIDGQKATKTLIEYHFQAEKTLSVNYELHHQGKIIAGTHSESYSDEWSDESEYKARRHMPSIAKIDSSLISAIAAKIAKDISPHQITVKFDFHHGKGDDNILLGITYVENKRYDQALSIFQQVYQNTTKEMNKAVAQYNIGLVYEMTGKFKQAFDSYTLANQIDPKEKDYIKALTRVEQRKQTYDRYKSLISQ